MTGSSQVRVGDSVLPVTQKLLSDSSVFMASHMRVQRVADGTAQQRLDTLSLSTAYVCTNSQQQQQVLTADVQSILGSLQDILETGCQAADLLKQFLADLNAIPEPSSSSTGAGAGGAAGAAGFTKEWD